MNFRSQRLGRHLVYNNHVKDTQGRQGLLCHVRPRCMISKGNHVEFARFVLLDVTGRSKNMTSTFASLTEQDIEKIVEDRDSQKTKRSTKVAKQLFANYVKEKKLREPGVFLPFRNKLSVSVTVVTLFFRSMYIKIIIRFGFCDIQNN